jgi:hypothetical protein
MNLRRQLWRYGSLALFVALPLMLLSLAITNILDAAAAHRQVARDQLALSQTIAATMHHQTISLSPREAASLYLESTSVSLAEAEIQQTITNLVTQAGGNLVETQHTGTLGDGRADTVAIKATLVIDNKGLLDLLYQIETGLPLLQITELEISCGDRTNTTSIDDGTTLAGTDSLQVQMSVSGHWRKAAG